MIGGFNEGTKDLELEKKEKAKETVLRAQKLAYDIKEKEEMKRRELERILAEDVAAAEEKKNSLLELRLERASSDVMRAKELANLKRLEESDASEKIRRSLEDSLAIAEENKQCYLSEIRLKAGMKNEHVRDVAQSMKEQQEWSARQKIEQLVEAMRVAEMKKNEHLMERSSKGGQVYYRAKEVAYCMKEIERLEAEKLAKELQTELIDAAAARDDIDKLRHDKVKDKLRRVEALKQERRLSGASFESPYPGITSP